MNHIRHLEQTQNFINLTFKYLKYSSLHCTGFPEREKLQKHCQTSTVHPVLDQIVLIGVIITSQWSLRKLICPPLLQNAQYAAEVMRNEITKYPDAILPSV